MKKIILIDNYDSFTFNLYHYLSSLKVNVDVIRNDKIDAAEIVKKKYNKIVISPGPGNPNQAGNCLKIVKKKFLCEASGNINLKNIKSYAKTKIDRISIGQLTHSIENVDFGLEI